ncbi:MAG TPA: PQQ-binding-like beta-propeller repeat protein [Galbitalea sp.]|jgi:outer membrane protein assembly factor BamB|nr:PQQ-binding-like beta-propeller repeat protein [Galbitalea sp.]
MAIGRGYSDRRRRGFASRWWLVPIALAALLIGGCAAGSSGGVHTASALRTPSAKPETPRWTLTWTSYHADQTRTGAVPNDKSAPDPASVLWRANLGGAVFGQPLIADHEVIAATERNRVVALNPKTGAVIWSDSIGTPLTNVGEAAGCGDIDPLGITSTPVIDPATGAVFVVGEINDGGGVVHHELVAIDIKTGSVLRSENVDPPLPTGERSITLLQRPGLAVANGRIYIGFGGNDGDCGHYHGWEVAVNETGPEDMVSFEVASDGQGGAIWEAGGAPAIDSNGNLYVTTGNANPDPPEGGPDPKQYTESVVKLSPDLQVLASYKDRIAGGDEDLATGNPVLLPNGQVFAVGKTDVGYLLNQSNLSVVAKIPNVCDSNPDGGPAYVAASNSLFVPCSGGGIQVVHLTSHRAGARLSGANGAPILIGSTVWATLYSDGRLYEYNAATGARMQSLSIGSTIPHFASPSTAFGEVFVGTNGGVVAFAGPRP